VVSQFLGNIARGEDILLVDGGVSRRAFTHVSDGMDALMAILHNPGGVASGQIYNIGHPGNDLSVRALAEMMLSVAAEFPEYSRAARVRLVPVSAQDYYGTGYQDTPQRVPDIRNTCRDLGWAPQVAMRTALRQVFEAYRHDVQGAGGLAA
jgi:nucleoside-diphosphate-sugar epimerase